MASHSTQIPEAVRIAGSIDPSISSELKQEAIGYLTKVKELGEETWQVSAGVSVTVSWHCWSER